MSGFLSIRYQTYFLGRLWTQIYLFCSTDFLGGWMPKPLFYDSKLSLKWFQDSDSGFRDEFFWFTVFPGK